MPHTLLYSCTFSHRGHAGLLSCCAFHGLATHTASFFFFLCFFTLIFGHSHLKCPTLQHLKHFTSSSTFCYLTSTSSLTLHCITLLANTSNLFWEIGFPFSPLLLFLQLQARCPNFLYPQHFLPSNSALNLARAFFWLSILLIS